MPHIPKQNEEREAYATREDESGLQKHVSVGKISLKDFKVDPNEVYKQMFGREAVKDDIGAVVHARTTG